MQVRVRNYPHGHSPEEKLKIEARNLNEVMGFIASLDQQRREGIERSFFSRGIIEDIHRLTVMDIYPCGGQIRSNPTDQVMVTKAGFEPKQPYVVPLLLDELITKCQQLEHTPPKTRTSKVRAAAEIFHQFLIIHPFRGGNGRVARALLDLLLIRLDVTFPGAPIQPYLAETREHYFKVLRIADDETRSANERFEPLTNYLDIAVVISGTRAALNALLEFRDIQSTIPGLPPVLDQAAALVAQVPDPEVPLQARAYNSEAREIFLAASKAIQAEAKRMNATLDQQSDKQ